MCLSYTKHSLMDIFSYIYCNRFIAMYIVYLLTWHLPKLSVIFHGYVTSFFNLKWWIDSQFFTNSLAICFGPPYTPRVLLLLECSVTFWATKFKHLKHNKVMNKYVQREYEINIKYFMYLIYLTIISYEMHSMSWIYFWWTKITSVNTHCFVLGIDQVDGE